MLARCIAGADDPVEALSRYEATRIGTSRLQLTPRQNTWQGHGHRSDLGHGYDVWQALIVEAAARS